jgi:MauM/NapG family ferredoxin protein
MKRRTLLGGAIGAAFGALVGRVGRIGLGLGTARAATRLRPPGAEDGAAFLARCIRCFRCAEVCPPQAIRFESTGAPPQLSDTPFLEVRKRACILCMRCTEACPTGALQRIPAEHPAIARSVKMGRPVIDRQRCLAWNGQGVCRLCYYVCPYADRAIWLSGPRQAPIARADACVGCGLCEEACPDAARAIRVLPP